MSDLAIAEHDSDILGADTDDSDRFIGANSEHHPTCISGAITRNTLDLAHHHGFDPV